MGRNTSLNSGETGEENACYWKECLMTVAGLRDVEHRVGDARTAGEKGISINLKLKGFAHLQAAILSK